VWKLSSIFLIKRVNLELLFGFLSGSEPIKIRGVDEWNKINVKL